MKNCLIALLSGLILASLAGCAQAPKMLWVRTDGQRGSDDVVYAHQLEMARTVCMGERQKANLSGVAVYQGSVAGAIAASERATAANQVQMGCMAEKGYLLVREDEAEGKREELAAVAAEAARRDAATRTAAAAGRGKR